MRIPERDLSSDQVRHQSFASPDMYMLMMFTFSPSRIWTTLKYRSICRKKFSAPYHSKHHQKALFRDLDLVGATFCRTWGTCTHIDQSPQLSNFTENGVQWDLLVVLQGREVSIYVSLTAFDTTHEPSEPVLRDRFLLLRDSSLRS